MEATRNVPFFIDVRQFEEIADRSVRREGLKVLTRPVLPETAILAMACFVDMAVTIVLVLSGMAKETNPLLASLMEIGVWAFTAFKTASFIVPLAILEIIRPAHPRFIERALQLGLAGYLLMYLLGSIGVNWSLLS